MLSDRYIELVGFLSSDCVFSDYVSYDYGSRFTELVGFFD